MSLKEEERKIVVALELEKADKTLKQMEVQVEAQLWEMVANRLYYALFHAVSAMLIYDSHEVGSHRGAVNRFSVYYVKTELFTKEDGRLYSQLQGLREEGDYNCSLPCIMMPDVSKNVSCYLCIIPGTVLSQVYHKYNQQNQHHINQGRYIDFCHRCVVFVLGKRTECHIYCSTFNNCTYKSWAKLSISCDKFLFKRTRALYANTAGMAVNKPIAVAISASPMGAATVAIVT